jgi:hypothetical protein
MGWCRDLSSQLVGDVIGRIGLQPVLDHTLLGTVGFVAAVFLVDSPKYALHSRSLYSLTHFKVPWNVDCTTERYTV